jgi:predicted TPR repeat methyltransferase
VVDDVGCGTGRALPALRDAVGAADAMIGVDMPDPRRTRLVPIAWDRAVARVLARHGATSQRAAANGDAIAALPVGGHPATRRRSSSPADTTGERAATDRVAR